MTERCEEEESFPSELTFEELDKLFGGVAKPVGTAGDYNDARRKHGVRILDEGSFRMVHIKGGCPALQNGVCTLGPRCPKPVLDLPDIAGDKIMRELDNDQGTELE